MLDLVPPILLYIDSSDIKSGVSHCTVQKAMRKLKKWQQALHLIVVLVSMVICTYYTVIAVVVSEATHGNADTTQLHGYENATYFSPIE